MHRRDLLFAIAALYDKMVMNGDNPEITIKNLLSK